MLALRAVQSDGRAELADVAIVIDSHLILALKSYLAC